MGKLYHKNVLITGGSRGIGAAIARAYVEEGATVSIIHYNDHRNAETTLNQLKQINQHCLSISCDITRQDQVYNAIEAIRQQHGAIDILVNGAGIAEGDLIEKVSLDQWSRVLNTNLTGAFIVTQACYPDMKEKRWGRIINISSQMAFSGGVGASVYCAAKAGLVGFTRALAVEAAPFGVLVNSIAPGATMTQMLKDCGEKFMTDKLKAIPLGRFGTPEDIAPTAVLLASEDGAFFVGQTLSPNGGDVFR